MNIRNIYKRNWWAIFYFNFKMLPFKQAIKLPFDFFGKVSFGSLKGSVIIEGPVSRRMVEFGKAESAIFPNQTTILILEGTFIVKGSANAIGSGSVIEVGRYATLTLHKDLMCAPRTKIILRQGLTVGNHVSISWESQVFDSNFHYMRNINTGEVKPIDKEIVIGDRVWIGNRVTLNKGTVIPDGCVVASNSLCNKDYSREGKTNLVLAGQPAKVVAEGYERIFESVEYDLCLELQEKFKPKNS